jgi:hypothetical protein
MKAAQPLDPAKRCTLMERVAAELRRSCGRYVTDTDVQRALKISLVNLAHGSAA